MEDWLASLEVLENFQKSRVGRQGGSISGYIAVS
jgi:hypothetical protein